MSVFSRFDNIKDQAKDVMRAFLQEYSKKSGIKSRMKQYYNKSKLTNFTNWSLVIFIKDRFKKVT